MATTKRTIAPHKALTRRCKRCATVHAPGQHRSHGVGSFQRTHGGAIQVQIFAVEVEFAGGRAQRTIEIEAPTEAEARERAASTGRVLAVKPLGPASAPKKRAAKKPVAKKPAAKKPAAKKPAAKKPAGKKPAAGKTAAKKPAAAKKPVAKKTAAKKPVAKKSAAKKTAADKTSTIAAKKATAEATKAEQAAHRAEVAEQKAKADAVRAEEAVKAVKTAAKKPAAKKPAAKKPAAKKPAAKKPAATKPAAKKPASSRRRSTVSEPQSIRFLKSMWTAERAAEWLRAHDKRADQMEAGGPKSRYWHFRQHDPNASLTYRPKAFGDQTGIQALLEIKPRAKRAQKAATAPAAPPPVEESPPRSARRPSKTKMGLGPTAAGPAPSARRPSKTKMGLGPTAAGPAPKAFSDAAALSEIKARLQQDDPSTADQMFQMMERVWRNGGRNESLSRATAQSGYTRRQVPDVLVVDAFFEWVNAHPEAAKRLAEGQTAA